MANISSYNQLSSWNEDDDLLFVQQPDAPKKAHPSQMKEYVEAGDFEATGEIKDGNGNVLSGVVEEIGDLTQTGLTGDSVAEQLDTARGQIESKRSLTVSSSIIGNGVNIPNATSTSPYTTPHEGFVRFDGPSCLCVNAYRMMKSSEREDYKGMWLPKGVKIYFTDGTPSLAQWFNCSNE
jgi:hypothetical protein